MQRNTKSCEISQRSATRVPFQEGDRVRWVDENGVDAKPPAYGTLVRARRPISIITGARWEVKWDKYGLSDYPESALRHLTEATNTPEPLTAPVRSPGEGGSQPAFRCIHFPSAIDNWHAGIQLCKYGCTDYKLEPWHNGTRRAK